MKKIISFILVFLLLSSQAVMALDTDNFTSEGQHTESSQNIPADNESYCGDHCCHSPAHFLGLVSSVFTIQSVIKRNPDLHTQFGFISQPRHPPTPPPIV